MSRPSALVAGFLLLVTCAAAQGEDDWQRLGLFRVRDLNYQGSVLRFGLTENMGSFNNTPDVGLTLSFGRIFAGHGDWHSED